MAALGLAAVASQQELAARMGVAPSLMGSLADDLERLGAVRRVWDPLDRCTSLARTLDEELVAGLTEEQRKALDEAMRVMAHRAGLAL